MRKIRSDLWNCRVAIAVIAVYLAATQILFGEVCPLKLLCGIPCPGCGLTRGCISIFTLQWGRSLEYNPASALWIAAIVYFVIRRYFAKADDAGQGSGSKRNMINKYSSVVLLIVLVAVTYAVYVWRMGTVYPGAAPMDYYENSILGTFFTAHQSH